MSKKANITLSCDHVLLFSTPVPRKRELVWCRTCDKQATVVSVHVLTGVERKEWFYHCANPDCRRIVYFGPSGLLCQKRAIAHKRNKGHVVEVFAPNGELFHRYESGVHTVSLPDGVSDDQPF